MIRIILHIMLPKRYKNRYKIRDFIPTFLWALWTFYIALNFWRIPVLDYFSEAFFDVRFHRKYSISAFSLRFLNVVSGTSMFLKLMVNSKSVISKINIAYSKTAELRYPFEK